MDTLLYCIGKNLVRGRIRPVVWYLAARHLLT